jgi:general secretion pathway protein E
MTRAVRKKIGEILVDRKMIAKAKLEEALKIQKPGGARIGEILIKKGFSTEEQIVSSLADQHGIIYRKTLEFKDPEGVLKKIPLHFLVKNRVVPFHVEKYLVLVGIADPLNIHPVDDLRMLLPDFHFEPVLTSEDEILRVINAQFGGHQADGATEAIDSIEEDDGDLDSAISETEDLLEAANDAPIIKLVNRLITQAVHERASDIHIEPFEQELFVRFRIDGILYKKMTPPKKVQNAVISRVKIMSGLNIAENRLPQDGRIQLKIGGKEIDIRVSTFPVQYGERIVMRLLNKTDMNFNLDSIGFDPHNLELFKKSTDKPHGVILVTGPTGSGKTTTLYSALTRLNTEDVNILTVEDPIEYQLPGVGQMHVRSKIDLTFASGLRAILRQDPDIVMVGEIRDLETAEIAIQAALTGHRVFSTLHTNDAASAVTRLIDMGIEPFLIASSVNAFLAQRLVRTLCPKCKKPYKPTPKEMKETGITPAMLKKGKLFKNKGCPACFNTGYLGRVGIYELLPITQQIRNLILARTDASQIKSAAVKEGMRTLLVDGVDKALRGITTLEEVLRVSGSIQE